MKNASKFTPGPWTVERTERTLSNVQRTLETTLVEYTAKGPSKYSEADARLIAAAPELLEALIEASNDLDAMKDEHQDELKDLIAKVNRAIAKATGGGAE